LDFYSDSSLKQQFAQFKTWHTEIPVKHDDDDILESMLLMK
jgi:hypothetical protein